jgi:XTP/dITP diphosphohydrolase
MAKPIVVLATQNAHKRAEIARILGRGPFRVKGLEGFPSYAVRETGKTLAANALLKARAAARRTGLPALSDDTGLEVSALGGRPGVYSARFAGPGCGYDDNNRKLLRLLKSVPRARRTAVFRTVVAFVVPGGKERLFEGRCRGRIADAPRGKRGFGYDPVFEPAGEGRTFAELSVSRKNEISHRALAFRRAAAHLRSFFRS